MITRFPSLLVALCGFVLPLALRGATMLWVDPAGDDTNPGTEARPFATVGRMQAALRELAGAGLKDDVVVRFRGGVHRFTETIELTPGELGDGTHAVTFMAQPGERAIWSGARPLAGKWERVERTLWRLEVPAGTVFRQLFREGEGLRRAREPDAGHYTLKAADSARRIATINEELPAEWGALTGVELNTTAWWHFNRQPLEAIDPAGRRLIARRAIGTDASSFKFGNRGHERIWLENARLFADEPGEWFLDPAAGRLWLRAAEGEDPNRAQFTVPVLRELVVVRGGAKQLVRHVRFAGLEIAETDWELPPEGRLGIQAGAWGWDRSRTFTPGAALRFIYAWDISVEDCRFRELGDGAIAFEIGTRLGRVARCEFFRVGANVLQVGRMPEYVGDRHPLHRDFRTWGDWSDELEAFPNSQAIWLHTSTTVPEAPSRIDLVDNTILDSCHLDYGSVGIWVGYANHVRIEHNHLRNLPYTGINVGWRWGPGLTNCHSNLVARNRIEGVMRQVGDGAGIYLVGEQPGTKVLENFVRDSGGNYWAHGIYMDESSDHMEIAGNYVNAPADFSLFLNRNGLNQVIRDNNGETGSTLLAPRDDQGRWKAQFNPERTPADLSLYGPRQKNSP